MSIPANAIFREAYNLAIGNSSANPFSYSNDVADADFKKAGLAAGQRFGARVGNVEYIFRLVRADTALAQGEGVKLKAPRTGTLASSTKAVSTTASTYVASQLTGGLIFLTANTGAPALRHILDNSDDSGASTVTVAERNMAHNIDAVSTANAWSTAPDNTTTFSIYCPWEVGQMTAATDFVVGVALNTVTDENWTYVLERGPVLAKVVGSTDATTALGPIVPSGTAGVFKGPTAAGITASEAARVCGYAIDAYAGAAALRLVHFQSRFNS